MTRHRVLALVALAALGIAAAQASSQGAPAPARTAVGLEGDAVFRGADVGVAQLAALETALRRAPRDPSGTAGAGGGAATYRASAATAGASVSATMRLYRTGWLGFEPTMGISRDGAIYVRVVTCLGGQSCSQPHVLKSVSNGGRWTDVSPPVGSASQHLLTQDPFLYLDPRTGRIFSDDLILPCSQLSFSDDAGRSWTSQVVGCDQTDHQNIFAGPVPKGGATTTGYPDVVYYCAMNAGGLYGGPTSHATTCAKSLDGGQSFTITGPPPYTDDPSAKTGAFGIPGACDGGTGKGTVAPDGTIYLPRGWCGRPYVAISTDEGQSWQRVQVSSLGMNTMATGTPDHNAAVGVDAKGTVYYAWVARNRQPYLSVSRDRGRHWSTPVDVAPPGPHQANQPSIAVGAPGRVAISFVGSTTAPAAPFPDDGTCNITATSCPDYASAYAKATWNGYLVQTVNALSSAPTFVGGAVNDPRRPLIRGECGPGKCQQEYDFLHAVINPKDGTPWATYVDGCRGQQTCSGMGEVVLGRIVGAPRLL